MSLVKKLKDILFEVEEDETETIKIHDDDKNEIKSVKIEPDTDIKVESKNDTISNLNEKKEVIEKPTPSERNLFNQDNGFKFPDFDEEEFQSSISRTKQNANVLEIERKKNLEARNDYRYERTERDNRPQVEKKKFSPSPIISPVYGILNQDYKAEDIVNKSDNNNIDIDTVRKKAFETQEKPKVNDSLIERPSINDIINENITVSKKEETIESIEEPVVTFFDEKDEERPNSKDIPILLEEAADEISLEDTLEIPKTNNLDAIEEELEKIDEETKESHDKDLDDTLDSDLFELIDSMYENREEE